MSHHRHRRIILNKIDAIQRKIDKANARVNEARGDLVKLRGVMLDKRRELEAFEDKITKSSFNKTTDL